MLVFRVYLLTLMHVLKTKIVLNSVFKLFGENCKFLSVF